MCQSEFFPHSQPHCTEAPDTPTEVFFRLVPKTSGDTSFSAKLAKVGPVARFLLLGSGTSPRPRTLDFARDALVLGAPASILEGSFGVVYQSGSGLPTELLDRLIRAQSGPSFRAITTTTPAATSTRAADVTQYWHTAFITNNSTVVR